VNAAMNLRFHIVLEFYLINDTLLKGKGKVFPLQARCGPEGG